MLCDPTDAGRHHHVKLIARAIEALSKVQEIQMVHIPGGTIKLRDDRIHRRWHVDLRPYLIGRYPVTQALYAELTGQSPSSFVGAKFPVESVSWLDAVRFCNLLSQAAGFSECYDLCGDGADAAAILAGDGYRLPSEAEWEYACRAETKGPRYGEIDSIAWYHENSGGHVHEVGTKQPNAWGVYDMLGNVWEWCSDQYDPQVYGSYRVFRGGGWADRERGCLATNRRRSHPTFKVDDLGFRLARSL